MLIRLIGPVTITAGEKATRISAPKRACVLAVLAAEPGVPVSQTDLIDRVWGGEPPETVTSVLYSYIARLRTELKPAGVSIERAGAHGYALTVAPDDVDVHRVRDLASRAAAAQGAEALELWRRACALADGEVLAGIGGRWAAEFRAVFDDARLGLLSGRYGAELAAGRHAAVIGELSGHVTAEPLAEPLVGQLMLALYRDGRAAEALRWFESTRVQLRDELGADPSAELRELHLRILDQSPDLDLSTEDSAPAAAPPSMLPADISSFTGRDEQLSALSKLARLGGLALVTGQGGAGKTALTIHWGQTHRDLFPDGQLYINLRGFDRGEAIEPRDALGRLLLSLGVAGDAVPEDVDAAAELFRSHTDGRRMLVVLDNAGDIGQVRPLLPGASCFTVVTSRNRLPGLVALNDAQVLDLDVLARDDSDHLLRRLLGDERIDADPEAADALARLCGDLPLALRIAAANLASGLHHSIAAYVGDLEKRDRLALLAVDGDPDATVTAALDSSYRSLDADARGLLCRFGVIPAEDAPAELLIIAADLPEESAQQALRRLATSHLVEEYKPGRYRMHDLVKLYAAAKAAEDLTGEERESVVDAFIERHEALRLTPDIDDELSVLAAAEVLKGHPRRWRMLKRLGVSLNYNRFSGRAVAVLRDELARCEKRVDAYGMFMMTNLLANAARRMADAEACLAYGVKALELSATLDTDAQITARGNLGLQSVDRDHRQAEILLTEAVDLAIETGNRRLQILHGLNLARICSAIGRFGKGRRYLDTVEALNADSLTPEQRGRIGMVRIYSLLDQWRNEEALAESERVLGAGPVNARMEAYLLMLGVEAQCRLRQGEQALAKTNRALALLEKERMVMLGPRIQQAEVHIAMGESARGIELLDAARRDWQAVPAHEGAILERVLATAHLDLGRLPEAHRHARLGADGFGAIGAHVKHAEALLLLAVVEDARGEVDDAERHRAQAAELMATFEPGMRTPFLRAG